MTKPIFFTLLLLLALRVAVAASDPAIRFRAVEDVVYGNKDGLALTMDVLVPEQNAKRLGVIILSSGSWKSRKSLPEEEAKLRAQHWVSGLLRGGYTVFVVRHGSSPRYFVPEMIDDVRRSVRFVRMHAKEYNIDPDHIGLTGGSSGGHLSLMAALTADDGRPDAKDPLERVSSRVQAVVAWFPPTDLINWGKEKGFQELEKAQPELFTRIFGKVTSLEAQLKTISPIYYAGENSPPLLLIHGDADKTVPVQQSHILRAKYEELKRPVKLIIKPGGGHTFWFGIEENYPDIWKWFDTYLK
ncbi:MAG TPA: alpha/beta hydrolase [Blastocatellia bacterium]|nr:alpha/beta hydrolase [Blastocatellia bacterium]